MSNREASCLAKAVAEREISTAVGPEAMDRIGDARACAHDLDDAFAARMKQHDSAGAAAALARIESGGLDLSDARMYAGDAQPGWRAVAARGLVRREDREARLRAMLDPDPRVRRQGVRAARDAKCSADLDALAEAARVDPEPIVRTEAVRAIAALEPAPQNSNVVDVLRDLWKSGDDGLREDIALAWSAPALWHRGGRDALRLVVAEQHGSPAIEAAAAVLRHRDADAEVAQAATAQLAWAIEAGPVATRLQALAQAPLDRGDLLTVVKAAAGDDDVQVRVGALARLAESKDPRAIEELESLARAGSPVADRARFALAALGDRRVQAWIEQELTAVRPERRLAAATELAAMGVAARGAPLLADGDASVRTRASCTLMMAARAGR
jgi:HEAT repeat protein